MNYQQKAIAINTISTKIQRKALFIKDNENHINRLKKDSDEFNFVEAHTGGGKEEKVGTKGPYQLVVKNSQLIRALLDANEDLKAEIRALERELAQLLNMPEEQ